MDNDPGAEGREAHDAGESETSCPYPEGSDDEASWLDGWNAAAEDAA